MKQKIMPTGIEQYFDKDEIIVSKTDPKGRLTYTNQVFMRLAGYDEKHLLNQPHSIIRHPDMPRCVFKLLWDTLESKKEIFAYVVNLCKNGDHYWVIAHVTPSLNAAGEINGYHSNRRVPDRAVPIKQSFRFIGNYWKKSNVSKTVRKACRALTICCLIYSKKKKWDMMNLSSLSKAKTASILAILAGLGSAFIAPSMINMALIGLIILCLFISLYFLNRTNKEIERTKDVCRALTKGDFEIRLTNITEGGNLRDLQWAVNEMTDSTDAFIRESTAAMEYVSNNQYFRRILEDGMQGDLLKGARIINNATESVGEKMKGFTEIANDFDMSLKDVVANINSTVSNMSTSRQKHGRNRRYHAQRRTCRRKFL